MGWIVNSNEVSAAGSDGSPTISISPTSGFTGVGEEFWLEVKLNTDGAESLSTRAVIIFDPVFLELKNVEAGSIYCDHPTSTSEYGSSNEVGYVVVTGTCSDPISTSGEEILATLYFEAIEQGDTQVGFRYNGNDEPGNTVIYGRSSPPTNILNDDPIDGSYKIVEDLDKWSLDSPQTFSGFTTSWMWVLVGALTFMGFALYLRKLILAKR